MRSARVALFEHDQGTRDTIRGAIHFPAVGHSVVSEAPSLGMALHVVSLMRTGHSEVNAVILSPDMTTGEDTGTDAKVLVEKLRALAVTPMIIGYASVPMAEYGVMVDADVSPEEFAQHPAQISKLLSSF